MFSILILALLILVVLPILLIYRSRRSRREKLEKNKMLSTREAEIREWGAQGYDVAYYKHELFKLTLKEATVKDLKVIAKEFERLAMAIERLKQAEKELDELNPPENTFRSQIESIRWKLKRPEKVDEVEQELSALRKQVQELPPWRARRAEEARRGEAAAALSFPRELEQLYQDVTVIGSGGFARVFRAKRRADGTEVAVKVPLTLDASTGKSFVREITSWQQLRHLNIVRLYDLNILPVPYLEMELCQRSLNELPKPIDTQQAACMLFHIGEGMRYAHSKGIIHRDLKPQNILLQGEVPKVTDWGLSKIAAESASSTHSAFSPLFAAPEQLLPQNFGKPDKRTDIYQLGTVFYQLATGELPFKGDNFTELMAQITSVEPKKPAEVNPSTKEVEPIIMKCLRKEMKERYQSVADMQKDLAEYLKVEFKDSLSKSKGDMRRSGYYCAELCFIHLTRGDLGEALKYAVDLKHYASNDVKADLDSITGEIEHRLKERMGTCEELMEKAGIVLHQAMMRR